MTRAPRVSFVVPCYKLGHLLGECITSILSQSYEDFEVIVMDDCSPDATGEVVAAIRDPRVRCVRNGKNLGHMRNYNRGVAAARGTYVWLISADDRLRRPYVLERFVAVMDRRPHAGYVFCPVVRFQGAADLRVYGDRGAADAIFPRRRFFTTLLDGNCVPAASAMARKECYMRLGMYPLDLPFANDWYIWALFAFAHDVAYLAEPMVGWRVHEGNMTNDFRRRPDALVADEVTVRWRLLRMCEAAGDRGLERIAFEKLCDDYANRVVRYTRDSWPYGLTEAEFEASLIKHGCRPREQALIRGAVYAALGDHAFEIRDLDRARELYGRSLHYAPRSLKTHAKLALVNSGPLGVLTRSAVAELRAAVGHFSQPRSAKPLGERLTLG